MTPLVWLGVSSSVLLVLGTLYLVEDSRGHRIILSGFREFIDRFFYTLGQTAKQIYRSLSLAVTRFILQHGVHRWLRSFVNYVIELEQRVERVVRHNRHSGDNENRERNHLDEIADHKEATSLSQKEKQQRRSGK